MRPYNVRHSMNIVVTVGAGYIGPAAAEALPTAGHGVTVGGD